MPANLENSAVATGLGVHPYMTTGKTTALTVWSFVGKVMSLFCERGGECIVCIYVSMYVYDILPKMLYRESLIHKGGKHRSKLVTIAKFCFTFLMQGGIWILAVPEMVNALVQPNQDPGSAPLCCFSLSLSGARR